MIDSFKEYISYFESEIRHLFFEMARRVSDETTADKTKTAIPSFDEDDKTYYKYIIDKVPQQIKENPKFLAATVRQAICKRYGQAGAAGGKLAELHDTKQETLDATFNIGGKIKFTIGGVPFATQKLWDKCILHGWDPKKDSFGYKYGNCSSDKMEEKARQYIRYFSDENHPAPEKSSLYYYTKDNHTLLSASREEELKYIAARERGVSKPERFTEPNAEMSLQGISLDEEDHKYLDSVVEKFKEKYGTHFGMVKGKHVPMLPGMGEDDPNYVEPEKMEATIKMVQAYALLVRYSDHWISQDSSGKFAARAEYTSSDHESGVMYGPVNFNLTVNHKKKNVELKNVYLNLPHLVKKFEQTKKQRNFVKEPLYNPKGDNSVNLTRMRDSWLKGKMYFPNSAVGGTEVLRDRPFYDQMSIDHDLYRKAGGKATLAKPLKDEGISARCTWRKRLPTSIHPSMAGKEIITEDPLVEDANLDRNVMDMSLEDVLKDDAKIAFNYAVKSLANRRYAKDPGFIEWAKQKENELDAVHSVWGFLATQKHGSEGYRSATQRIQWGKNFLEAEPTKDGKNQDSIPGMYKGRGKGVPKDDEYNPLDQTADTGRGTGGGGDYTTHDEEEPQVTPSVRSPGEESPEQVAQRHAVVQPELQPIVTPSIADLKRIGVKPLVWMRLSRQDKINVLKSAGLPHPAS